MPKLSQQQVQAAETQGYNQEKSEERRPLPTDKGQAYVYKLVGCTSGPVKSDPTKTKIQWTWEFQLDGRYHPQFVGNGYLEKLWAYTPVDGGKEWAIAKMLHNFGYSPDTDTDELINDEATILVFPVADTYGTPPKTTMKARRFATHYEDDYPQAVSPMEQEANDYLATHKAQAAAAPETDPWDVPPASAPETVPAAAVPAQEVGARVTAAPAADEDFGEF